MLPAFMAAYPHVCVVLVAENRFVDMPAEPADLVIRVGPLPDSDLIARRLLVSDAWLCASPGYLSARGTPGRVADLTDHALIGYSDRPVTYQDGTSGSDGRIELTPSAAVSDSAALLPAVLGGAGIAHLPDFLAAPCVTDGSLIRLWPESAAEQMVVSAVYPSHRSLSAKVRVFIDSLVITLEGNRGL